MADARTATFNRGGELMPGREAHRARLLMSSNLGRVPTPAGRPEARSGPRREGAGKSRDRDRLFTLLPPTPVKVQPILWEIPKVSGAAIDSRLGSEVRAATESEAEA